MTFVSISTPVQSIRRAAALSALSMGLLLTACGGGAGDDLAVASAQPAAAAAAAAPAATGSVAVEGCVLDRHHLPTTGTPVRALSADGRLLGNAESDARGRFTLRLPAQSQVTLQVDRPGGESLPMRVDASASTWDQCLQDELA